MFLRRFLLSFSILSFVFAPFSTHGSGYIVNSIGANQTIESRKKIIETVLESASMSFGYKALAILLDIHQIEPRGKMQGKSITLSANIVRDGEFLKLLTHELGHYVDIYTLVGSTDPSDVFYRISWQDKTTKKSGETISNFVSGYAATNKYEDFAESFVFYIFHNREFSDRAMKNDALRQKYLFFSRHVFPRGDFMDTDFRIGKIPSYLWDTTKVPISVKKYLYSLQ